MGLGVGIASEEGAGTRVIFTFPHDRRRAMSDPPPWSSDELARSTHAD